MFEKYLEKLIKQKLGAFLDGMDQRGLQFGMTEANLSLNNVKLKQDALLKLNMPINIELGEIKHLDIKIPWMKLSSKPVVLSIEGLNIIVSLQKRQDWKVFDIFNQEYLEQTLLSYIAKVESELSTDEQQGYFSKLAMKVLDNIQIKIKDIHLRFEDHFSSNDQSYSFGMVLKLLEVQTTNENWVAQFVDRTQQGINPNLFKMIVVEGFCFYLNPHEKIIIHQQTNNHDKRLVLLESMIRNQQVENQLIHYLLKPMNLSLQIEHQTKGLKKASIKISLESVHLSFLRNQLNCLIKFMEVLSDFRTIQNQLYKTKKYKFLRPRALSVTRENAKEWWIFAYQCIKRSNKANNGSLKEFAIPKTELKDQRKIFDSILDCSIVKKDGANTIVVPPERKVDFIHIMSAVDPITLKAWTKEHLKPLLQQQQESQNKGFTSWLTGGKSGRRDSRAQVISDQEMEALEQEMANIPDFKPGTLQMNLQLSINEFILDVGAETKGGLIEGIRIFSAGNSIAYNQLPTQELMFDMKTQILDFGVELFAIDPKDHKFIQQESIIVSNKKIYPQTVENQWTINIRKMPEESKDIEYDIELIANPLLAVYHKEFVKRAIMISKIGLTEETQTAALDKIEDIKEATSSSIYTIIYKKSNRFRINIASPIIVLPLSADANPQSPIWVLRLGDLKFFSIENKMMTSVVEYEKYELIIDSMRLQFYHTYEHWQRSLENIRNFRDRTTIVKEKSEKVFYVLEDCSLQLDIAIKQKKAGMLLMTQEQRSDFQVKPKLILSGKTSDIKVNLTHSVYNKLVNLASIFDMSSLEEIQEKQQEDQIESKQAVMKHAVKIGQVQKKFDFGNQWEGYFCVLSGGYLYFYKDANQLMPATYYYIRGAQLSDIASDIDIPHLIVLKNRYGECILSLQNESQHQAWYSSIRRRITEMKLADIEEQFVKEHQGEKLQTNATGNLEQFKKNQKKSINHQAIVTTFQLDVPQVKAQLIDELKSYQPMIMFSLEKLMVNNVKKKTETKMVLEIKEIALVDLLMPVNQNLIGKYAKVQPNADSNQLQIVMTTLQKNNPSYTGIESQTNIMMDNLCIMMQPISFNEVLKFFKNTKPGCSYNLMTAEAIQQASLEKSIKEITMESESLVESHQNQSRHSIVSIHPEQHLEDLEIDHHISCQKVKEMISKTTVVLSHVSITFLHQEYHMQVYRLDSEKIDIDFDSYYDHFFFDVRFKDASIFDLTGYPYTINPKTYAEDPSKFKKPKEMILASINLDHAIENGLSMHYESYSTPKCALKKKGYHSKLTMTIQPMSIVLFNEAFMRFFFYLFEQFLNSLIYTDPYSNPLKEEFENLRRRNTIRKETVKKLIDFKQDTEIIEMHIKLSDFGIIIPDRPDSKNALSLKVDTFTVTQHLHPKAGRIPLNKEKELFVKSFRMNAENSKFMFGDDIPLTEAPFNMQIVFENLAYSPLLSKIDPQLVEQASHLRIRFDPIQLTMRQDIYTSILRILDLNINYTDFLQREYYFFKYVEIEEYFKTMENIIAMRMKISFKCLSLRLQHIDKSFLSELMLMNTSINIVKYRDYLNNMNIHIKNFFIFDRQQAQRIYQMDAIELHKVINQDDCVIQPKATHKKSTDEEVLENKKKAKKDTEQQVVIKMVTKPNGEKSMNVDIQGLRITIKPHVLMMVYYFLLNSFPEYDENAIDKPSYYDFDPESAPRMQICTEVKECLLLFQNRPGLKILACNGHIQFEMIRENVKDMKKAIDSGELDNPLNIREDLLSRNNLEEEQKGGDQSSESKPTKVSSDIVWSMRVKIEEFCPFVCSLHQLIEAQEFEKISKRQLMNPICLTYITTYQMLRIKKHQMNRQTEALSPFEYGVKALQDFNLSKIKAKISLQDLHLLFQIITFANYNITNEYIKKLEKIDQYIKQQREEKQQEACLFNDAIIERFDRKKTFRQDFGIIIENSNEKSEQGDIGEENGEVKVMSMYDDQQDNFAEILNQQYEQTIAAQMQRFRSTTKAFQKIAHKYTIALKKSNLQKSKVSKDSKGVSFAKEKSTNEERKSLTPTNSRFIGSQASHFNAANISASQQSRFTQHKPKTSQLSPKNDKTTSRPNIMSSPKYSSDSSQNNEQDLDQFYDAKSDLFFTVNEQGQNQNKEENVQNEMQFDNQKILGEQQEDQSYYLNKEQNVNHQDAKKKYLNALEKIISQKWTYTFGGLQILFINDYDNVFCPVIDLEMPEIEMTSDCENNTYSTSVNLQKLKIFYFNAVLGDWEPFLESFFMNYEQIESNSADNLSKQIFLNVTFPRPININLTESCLQNLIETYYSWMETPPYQYDQYQRKKELEHHGGTGLEAVIMTNKNSINDQQLVEQKLKNSNTGSINDDPNFIEDEESVDDHTSATEEGTQVENLQLNSENFSKVSPYSIKNLSGYAFKVASSSKLANFDQFEDPFDQNNNQNSFIQKRASNDIAQGARLSILLPDTIEVSPNQIVDYSVDLDKESNNFLIQSNKRFPHQTVNLAHQSRNRASTVMTGGTGLSSQGDLKKRYKNEELITIIFDNFEEIKNLDLNKIAQGEVDLFPREGIDKHQSMVERQGSGAQPPVSSSSEAESRASKQGKRKSKFVMVQDFEKLRYGITLNKMRKILTIRQEYILDNKTQLNFLIRLAHNDDKNFYKEYQLNSGQQFGICSTQYRQYSLILKAVSTNGQILGDTFSEPLPLSDLIKLNADTGRTFAHNEGLFTYIKKVQGSIKDTYDLVLLPTVSVKNCMPCGMEIMSIKQMAEDAKEQLAEGIISFDKEDQKHLHIQDVKGMNEEELQLKFRIRGFIWGNLQVKKKLNAEYDDIDVRIKDIDGYSVDICVRVQYLKAGFQLVFYAQTIIINQSSLQLSFFYNTLNRTTLAGLDPRHEYTLANREDSFLACLHGRYSKGLNIKNPGLTENFSIQTSHQNQSLDEETRSLKSPKTTFQQSEKKYEFVYNVYMSLVSEEESIYTKIVNIAPRFVIVNKIGRAICVAQSGNECMYDVVESGERREWIWLDSNLEDLIVVKKEDEDPDRDWGKTTDSQAKGQRTKWLWSFPINIKELGIMTISNKKEQSRFDNKSGYDIIKIIRKKIDGTTYVIFEEEDELFPLYRIENLIDDISVWYIQKGQVFEEEAQRLQPNQTTAYSFIDLKKSNQELQVFFMDSTEAFQKRNLGECHSMDFEILGQRSSIEFHSSKTGKDIKIYISTKTDGCSKILRFSDKSTEHEERVLKQLREASLKQRRQSKITTTAAANQLQSQVRLTKTVKININEILFSFVTRVTEREKKVMKSVRKEIAVLSFQNILLDKFISTDQHVDNNKIQIQSIQIDNQSAVNPLFPTILQPILYKYNETNPMIDIDINFRIENPEITYVDLLDFKFSGMVVKFDDRFLAYALTFANDLMDQLKTNLTGINPIFLSQKLLSNSRTNSQKDTPAPFNAPRDQTFFQNKNMIDNGDQIIQLVRKDTAKFGENQHNEGVIPVIATSKLKRDKNQKNYEANRVSHRSSTSKKSRGSSNFDINEPDNEVVEIYKNWRQKKIDGGNTRIFIRDCNISALNIEVSFLARKSMSQFGGKTAQSQIHANLNSWGLALINIDQAPITVTHFHQKQIFGLQQDITSLITSHYTNGLSKNVLSIVGSSSLFGNPTKFLNTLKNGLSDFKNLPIRGSSENGVKGFMKGALFGTVSLMKNTVEGTFGFAQSLSGQASKLLLVAAQDEDYLSIREEKLLTEKPRNVVEGVGFGAQTLSDSIVSGIFGTITRPVVCLAREGGWGLVKGIYQGASGAILKPMSGGLDLISKSTEGIKNTVKIFEAQLFKDRRRLPRTFYGYEEHIKAYNDEDSYIIIRILETLEGPFKKDHYIETIKFKDGDRTRFLVVSEEHIVLLDAAQKSLKWHIDSKLIKIIEKFKNGIMIHLSKKYDGRLQVPIEINNPKVLKKVHDKIKPLEQEEDY